MLAIEYRFNMIKHGLYWDILVNNIIYNIIKHIMII